MDTKNIFFHLEDCNYKVLHKTKIRNWITNSAAEEGYQIDSLNIIICSDDYLLNINKTHLKHNYYTDVITFQYSENQEISGDIYISIDTIQSNSKIHGSTKTAELHRVMIHGTLHLIGYKDKTPKDQALMTKKEDYYLSLQEF